MRLGWKATLTPFLYYSFYLPTHSLVAFLATPFFSIQDGLFKELLRQRRT